MEMLYRLRSEEHQLLRQGFGQWLSVLGYAPTSVASMPRHLQEFLYCQESRGKYSLSQLSAGDATDFINALQTRIGIRTGRGFSTAHINKYIQVLHLFSQYIRRTGKSGVGFTLARLPEDETLPVWLSRQEIRRLYAATEDDVLGLRDRAMLSVFYGCGLRLQEGTALECSDILHERRMLYVRRAKGYKERYVPIAAQSYQDLQAYLEQGRPELLQAPCAAVFIDANKGRPITKQSLYIRIKGLVRKAGIIKPVGTHTLRHSIATHLLESGMKLERIQAFLGHAALDSTQVYTHLINEPTIIADEL
ncbi:MAG: tyrosine-type recombinase/integrase [Chitinophagaceae bacterium]|nr:tyrosine-type recombinase/integrase [Chitinophagaceae bacterium]